MEMHSSALAAQVNANGNNGGAPNNSNSSKALPEKLVPIRIRECIDDRVSFGSQKPRMHHHVLIRAFCLLCSMSMTASSGICEVRGRDSRARSRSQLPLCNLVSERHITPKWFAASMCRDMHLPPSFILPIAASIRRQIKAYKLEVRSVFRSHSQAHSRTWHCAGERARAGAYRVAGGRAVLVEQQLAQALHAAGAGSRAAQRR